MARRFRRSRGPRRKTTWDVGPQADWMTTGETSAMSDLSFQIQMAGTTLARTRGRLNISNSGTDQHSCIVAFGICLVPENAWSAGSSAIPAPWDDIAWDGWLWHHSETLVVNSGALFGTANSHSIEIDVKAMRKVKEGDVMVGMFQKVNVAGTPMVVAGMSTRQLYLLP